MRAWDVVWGSAKGSAIIQNNYVDVSDVVITFGRVAHQDRRTFLDRVSAQRRRRRDRRPHRDPEPSGGGPSARLYAGRLRPGRHADRRVPHQRQIPDAATASAGWRSPTAWRTVSRSSRRRLASGSRAMERVSRTFRPSRAEVVAPAPPSLAGTAPTRSISMRDPFPPSRSRRRRSRRGRLPASWTSPPAAAGRSIRRDTTCGGRSATCSSPTRASARSSAISASTTT